jgi:hypothetical protein
MGSCENYRGAHVHVSVDFRWMKGIQDEGIVEKQGNFGFGRKQHGNQRLFVNGRIKPASGTLYSLSATSER